MWRLSDSNLVLFLQGAGVEGGVTDGSLEMLWCTRFMVRVDRGSGEFFWSFSSLISVVGYSVGDGGRG